MEKLLNLIARYGNACAAAVNAPRNSTAAREAHLVSTNQLANIRRVLETTPAAGYQMRTKSSDGGWEPWQLTSNSTAEMVRGRDDYQLRRVCVHPLDSDA